MTNNLVLTKVGREKLEKELDELINIRRPEVINKIEVAKEQGDLSENAEYHDAKDEQGLIENRIREIQDILKNAEMMNDIVGGNEINIGSQIQVEMNGEKMDYTIVGFNEQNPGEGKISNESPMGQAFMGHVKGDEIEIKVPKGVVKVKILDVK